MNERQLLAFKYVLQYGSVTKAAELLHVTQSAVSQMITNLEYDLGFSVFERRQGKVASSTHQGRRFLVEAEGVLASMEKARRAGVELKNMTIGNFRITATAGLAMSLVPKALAKFHKLHPTTTTSLQTHHSREVHELVASQIFDIGICQLSGQMPDVETHHFSVNCSLVCHRDDPLSRLSLVTPKDLVDRIVISPYDQNPTTIALRDAFQKEGVPWHAHVACNLYAAACQMVMQGGAVTWADPFTLSMFSDPALCIRPFAPDIPFHFAILVAPQEREVPEATEMISLIREQIETV